MMFMHGDGIEHKWLSGAEEAFDRCVRADLPGNSNFADRERYALQLANELVRRHLESTMQAVADAQTREIRVDGVLHRQHQMGAVKYHSLCGSLEVRRFSYRPVGVRNGRTCVPLDLQLGIVERVTPRLAYCIAQGYAKGPMRCRVIRE